MPSHNVEPSFHYRHRAKTKPPAFVTFALMILTCKASLANASLRLGTILAVSFCVPLLPLQVPVIGVGAWSWGDR